mgnify:CR=1 FL=1
MEGFSYLDIEVNSLCEKLDFVFDDEQKNIIKNSLCNMALSAVMDSDIRKMVIQHLNSSKG